MKSTCCTSMCSPQAPWRWPAGTLLDNGVTVPVEAGNVLITTSGSSHGLRNTGSEDIVFVVLVNRE